MSALANLIDRSRREREDWCYTDVEQLLGTVKNPPANPVSSVATKLPCLIQGNSQNQRIVFRNGVWQKNQTQFGDLPATILQGDAASGYRLTLAAQSCLVTAPIELVFLADGAGEGSVNLTLDVGANASLTIVEHHVAIGAASAAQVIEMTMRLGNQSKLNHKKIVHGLVAAPHFSRNTVWVEAGAYYRNFQLLMNAHLVRSENEVTLAGSLAQCGLYGAMLLQRREHADVLTRVNHAAPNTSSQQLYKAVVKDQAQGVFQGKIKVAEGAQKSDGKQLCRALLLSDQAEMDAKPELEIYADDVSCSHGCAIGDLDADAMFYLRSRGLSENAARSLLLRGFIDEVLDTIQADDARSYMRELAGRWLHEQN